MLTLLLLLVPPCNCPRRCTTSGRVAYIGQADVNLQDGVCPEKDDLLVPSGANDGTATVLRLAAKEAKDKIEIVRLHGPQAVALSARHERRIHPRRSFLAAAVAFTSA